MDIQKREKMELLWSSVFSLFCISCVQRSWTTLAGESPVTVIASEPCS